MNTATHQAIASSENVWDKNESFLLTPAEAATTFKLAPPGAEFALHLLIDAPIVDDAGNDTDQVMERAMHGFTRISRREAVRLAQETLSDAAVERGARIRVVRSEYMRPWRDKPHLMFWIG